MKEIFIEYQNEKSSHSVIPFESVHSICYKFFEKKNINENYENVDCFYDGIMVEKKL